MIRRATEADVPALIDMGHRFHALSPWAHIPVDDDVLRANLFAYLGSAQMAIFVTDDLTGMIGAVFAPVFFASEYVVQEMFWYCEAPGNGSRLRKAVEEWAAEMGATAISIARLVGLNDERMDAMYRAKGYAPGEIFYYKAL